MPAEGKQISKHIVLQLAKVQKLKIEGDWIDWVMSI